MKKKKILFIGDAWNTLDHERDTTLRLCEEFLVSKHPTYYCEVESVLFENGKIFVDASPMLSRLEKGEAKRFPLSFFNQVHYRVDPPVNEAYRTPLILIAASPELAKQEWVNPMAVLLSQSEKTIQHSLPKLCAKEMISRNLSDLVKFGTHEKQVVLKPLYSAQSKGVEILSFETPNISEKSKLILQMRLKADLTPLYLQQYFPSMRDKGETRLWFVDGVLIGVLKKHALVGDFRVSIDQGSKLSSVELTKKEMSASREISKLLKKKKIRLAAVDLIENKITDFNFTSPGLLVQLEEMTGRNLSVLIVKRLGKA